MRLVLGRYDVKERNAQVQIVVDFAKRMEVAVVNTFQEEGGTKSGT